MRRAALLNSLSLENEKNLFLHEELKIHLHLYFQATLIISDKILNLSKYKWKQRGCLFFSFQGVPEETFSRYQENVMYGIVRESCGWKEMKKCQIGQKYLLRERASSYKFLYPILYSCLAFHFLQDSFAFKEDDSWKRLLRGLRALSHRRDALICTRMP